MVMNGSPQNGSDNGAITGIAPSNFSPEQIHVIAQRCDDLTNRVAILEAEQKRFMDALKFAGEFLMKNPASKMILMSLPKEVKAKLQETFGHVS